jgi:hypothetical protein
MSLVQVVSDTAMFVPGYERHTWKCSGCSAVEQRMTFTQEGTPNPAVQVEPTQTVPVEPTQTVPVEPTQTVLVEPTQAVPVEPIQTVPVEPTQTVPVEPTQAVPVEPNHPQPPATMLQTITWAKTLGKLRSLKEWATAAREAARETERHAQFNRDWDNLRSVPSPSALSEALSHVTPDEPVRSPTEPIASPAATAHDEPIPPASKPERARR